VAGPVELVFVAAGVIAGAGALVRPAVNVLLPALATSPEDLVAANTATTTGENLGTFLGPLLGGVLVAATGPDTAYWINAATFVVSALLIAGIPGRLLQVTAALSQGHWRDVAAGFALVRSSRPLLTVLVAWSIVMLANAAVNVAEVFLAKDVFDAGDFGYGFLVAMGGVGLVLGSVAGGSLIDRYGMRGPYGLGIAVMGAGYLLAATVPNVWTAAPFVVLAGTGNGTAVVCNAVLVQRGAPDAMRGRAFGLIMSTGFAVLGLGMIAAGPFTNEFGARAAWITAAGLCAAGATVGVALLRGSDEHAAADKVIHSHGPAHARERL
jgi:MFS family permease